MCFQTTLSRLKNDLELHTKSIFKKYKLNAISLSLPTAILLVKYENSFVQVENNGEHRSWNQLSIEEQSFIADELSKFRR